MSGSRGSILKRKGDSFVVKIFQRDPYYMKYLLYAIDHQNNPHVPKIKGKPIKIAKKSVWTNSYKITKKFVQLLSNWYTK